MAVIRDMCLSCYSRGNYLARTKNISREDYINNNYNKERVAWNVKVKKEKFIDDYKTLILTGKTRMTDYCKRNNITRQAFYERIKIYKAKGWL